MKEAMSDKELEFYGWETQHGTDEAVRIASEEWGSSENQVRILILKWEDSTKWQ